MAKYRNNLTLCLSITKALADETRVRALMLLQGRELCACQVIEVLGLAPSTVSKHLSILHQAGLVNRRKQGRWHYFQLNGDPESRLPSDALNWLSHTLTHDKQIADDQKKLEDVLKISPEELCCKQNL